METCSDVSGCVTAATTRTASSWMNPPPPALPRERCNLRYAEVAYGSSPASVNRLPCESFNKDRTSDVICPAVLYADEPTTGMGESFFEVKEINEVKEVKDRKRGKSRPARLLNPLLPLPPVLPLLRFFR